MQMILIALLLCSPSIYAVESDGSAIPRSAGAPKWLPMQYIVPGMAIAKHLRVVSIGIPAAGRGGKERA